MKKGSIGVTTENIFPIIKKFLYSDHEIFLRELVSNAVDATLKLKVLINRGEAPSIVDYEPRVTVTLDEGAHTLTISDMGIGMSVEEVDKYINEIAFSGAGEFMSKYEGSTGIIGHFGLGFYSAFMVASSVELSTKSYREGSEGVLWQCDGSPEFTLGASDKSTVGTDIVLHIAEDSIEFASKERIEGLLKKYCAFLPVPIYFGDNQINDTTPLWTLKPSDISEVQYSEFYGQLYPYSAAPLFHIHLNVDYPFNLTGILYFPELSNNFEVQRSKIQLYCNQVFVTDSVGGIVPEFLTMLHGVIDSPDIPLNVSRSYLQGDSNVRKISAHITKKVADRLADIFKSSRADYESKWDSLKFFVEFGVVSDSKFGERVEDFTLLKSSEGRYFSLGEYSDFIRSAQTDKDGKLVHLYASDVVSQYSYIAAARLRGYDVLVIDSPLAAHFISFLEHKYSDRLFVRVDSGSVDKLIDLGDSLSDSLSDDQRGELKALFEGVLPSGGDATYTVDFEAMREGSDPVVVTQNEFMRRMRDMSSVGGGGALSGLGAVPSGYTLSVNCNSAVVAALLSSGDSASRHATASSLVDLALLGAGLLRGASLSAFVQRQLEILSKT